MTTTLQRWNLASQQAASDAALRQRGGGEGSRGTAGADLTQSTLRITDLCSRVNLNTIRSERALTRFLGALASSGNRQDALQAVQGRARAILAHRGDSEPTSNAPAAPTKTPMPAQRRAPTPQRPTTIPRRAPFSPICDCPPAGRRRDTKRFPTWSANRASPTCCFRAKSRASQTM